MIDLDDIRTRYQQACKFLDERGRRLFAANEALALGHGGVTATSAATGLARSTIRRAIVELQSGADSRTRGFDRRDFLLRLTAAAESPSTSGSPPALPLSETDIYVDMDKDNQERVLPSRQ